MMSSTSFRKISSTLKLSFALASQKRIPLIREANCNQQEKKKLNKTVKTTSRKEDGVCSFWSLSCQHSRLACPWRETGWCENECVFRTYPLSLLSGDNAIGLAVQLVPNQEQLGLLWRVLRHRKRQDVSGLFSLTQSNSKQQLWHAVLQ